MTDKPTSSSPQANITHFGAIEFSGGEYKRVSGSTNWKVWPIAGFDPPIRAPVGMIEITFEEAIPAPYAVLVTACRNEQTPLAAANYGKADENGFVIHLWESIADRTVVNIGFSFAVIQAS